MKNLIDRLRLGTGTSPDHTLLLEAADALEKLATPPAAAVSDLLTDEQISEIIIKHLEGNDGYYQFARAIEAAIRSK